MTTRITARYVNPPKPGKTNGSIKTADGAMYGVKPDLLQTLKQGATYDVEYTSRDFNGQTYHTLTSARLVETAPQTSGSGGGTYGKTDDATAERIFVCGALNAAIHGGHIELSEAYIGNVVNMLRGVWRETFGSDGARKAKPDMGEDEVPF